LPSPVRGVSFHDSARNEARPQEGKFLRPCLSSLSIFKLVQQLQADAAAGWLFGCDLRVVVGLAVEFTAYPYRAVTPGEVQPRPIRSPMTQDRLLVTQNDATMTQDDARENGLRHAKTPRFLGVFRISGRFSCRNDANDARIPVLYISLYFFSLLPSFLS
jgi:hypothetical protein